MKKRIICNSMLAMFLALIMAVSSIYPISQVNAETSQQNSYYEDWNKAFYAVTEACQAYAHQYNEVQADVVSRFLEAWADKAYSATTKEESDKVLKQAKEAFKDVDLSADAMAEHKKVMEAREKALYDCLDILEANLANPIYTTASKDAYEPVAREYIGAAYDAMSMEEIETNVAAFEACESMLVKLPEEVIAAKEEAKLTIRKIIKEEFEGCFAEHNYDSEIDNTDTLEEIEQAIEDARADMLARVNRNISGYLNRKIEKIIVLLDTYEETLSAQDYEQLEDYIKETTLLDQLYNAENKASVDETYQKLVDAIKTKAEELENTPDDPEYGTIHVESISFEKAEIKMNVGDTVTLNVVVLPKNTTITKRLWTIGNADNLDIEYPEKYKIKLTAKKAGVSELTLEMDGKEASCTVTITDEQLDIKAERITLNKTSLNLKVGDKEKLTADLWPENVTDKKIVWFVSNPEIASVEDDGTVTALKKGTTTIKAKCGDIESEACDVNVRAVFDPGVTRIFGINRYETSLKIADAYKELLGVEKFRTVVVADGRNFPDALAGSYFAIKNNAPILMVNDKNAEKVKDYIRTNLGKGGSIYILGGKNAVSESFEDNLFGYYIERIYGNNRYETNLEILNAAGVGDAPILVCRGNDFADSLSASATGYPILLVKKSGLSAEQLKFLKTHADNPCYILGGTAAISKSDEQTISTIMASVKRIYGTNRYETSAKIAKEFFQAPDTTVLAYAANFPDGLCGGPLAKEMKAPLILIKDGKTENAEEYVQSRDVEYGIVLGGIEVLADETVIDVFALKSKDEIIKK